jgi:hypothetical protein
MRKTQREVVDKAEAFVDLVLLGNQYEKVHPEVEVDYTMRIEELMEAVAALREDQVKRGEKIRKPMSIM